MSLLLQALQKAAKNREAAQQTPEAITGFATSSGSTLELEPGEIEPPEPRRAREFEPPPEQAPARPGRETPPEPSAQQAAVVVSAAASTREPGFNVVDWARDHPVHIFAVIAGIFLALYFAYVVIEIKYPGFWSRSGSIMSPAAPPPGPIARRSSEQGPAANPAPTPSDASAPMPDLLPPPPAGQTTQPAGTTGPNAVSPLPGAPSAPPPAPGSTVDIAVAPASPTPSPVAAIAASAPAASTSSEVETLPTPKQDRRTSPPRSAAVRSATEGPSSVRSENRLTVKASDNSAAINAQLTEAYELLQKGQMSQANSTYERVLAGDGRNIDALLGLASIAWQEGRTERAAEHYSRILQLDPHNAAAQSGLIGLLGRIDPTASETRLKQLITREPTGGLYFALGNLYADQRLWSQAQQSYFQAFQMEPTNPDYAFNLAVGLEHLGQRKPALGYYRKALDLSFARGRAGFDQQQVIARIGELSLANE